jgi:hypothetical protein
MQPGRGRGGSGQEIRDSQWPLAKAGSFRLHQPSTFTAIRLADRGACDPERVFHIPLTQWRLMLPRPVTDLKPFVPARDAELSKRFYADLGFINWSTEQIAELQIGSYSLSAADSSLLSMQVISG